MRRTRNIAVQNAEFQAFLSEMIERMKIGKSKMNNRKNYLIEILRRY